MVEAHQAKVWEASLVSSSKSTLPPLFDWQKLPQKCDVSLQKRHTAMRIHTNFHFCLIFKDFLNFFLAVLETFERTYYAVGILVRTGDFLYSAGV